MAYPYTSHRRTPSRAFIAAWCFLVVVVAFGFFVQARTIRRLDADEKTIAQFAHQTELQQTRSAERLCGLLVTITPKASDDVIVKTFTDLGYRCTIDERG